MARGCLLEGVANLLIQKFFKVFHDLEYLTSACACRVQKGNALIANSKHSTHTDF